MCVLLEWKVAEHAGWFDRLAQGDLPNCLYRTVPQRSTGLRKRSCPHRYRNLATLQRSSAYRRACLADFLESRVRMLRCKRRDQSADTSTTLKRCHVLVIRPSAHRGQHFSDFLRPSSSAAPGFRPLASHPIVPHRSPGWFSVLAYHPPVAARIEFNRDTRTCSPSSVMCARDPSILISPRSLSSL